MFKEMIYSFKKSRKLSQLTKRLSPPNNFTEILETDNLNIDDIESAENELFNFCINDFYLSKVMDKYNANYETLDEVYNKLIDAGVGQIVRGHFIPASSLAFGFTLDYLLNHKDNDDFLTVAWALLDYFKSNRQGPLE